MHDAARAALPVAVALLVFAAFARGVLWAQIDDPAAERIAREYAEPLATWCLIALAAHVLALTAAGDACSRWRCRSPSAPPPPCCSDGEAPRVEREEPPAPHPRLPRADRCGLGRGNGPAWR